MKDSNEQVLTDNVRIRGRRKEYSQQLMSAINFRINRVIDAAEGTEVDEVNKVEIFLILSQVKRGKAVGR